MKRKVLVSTLVALIIGIASGLAIGWVLWPVEYTNTSPQVLRQDYHDDYVAMIAATYNVDHNLTHAVTRLKLVAPDEPDQPVVELAQRLIQAGGRHSDIVHLAHLAHDLGAINQVLIPFLEDPQ